MTRFMNKIADPWRIAHLLDEARVTSSLFVDFQIVKIFRELREANGPADGLANFAINGFSCFWKKKIPECIFSLVLSDLLGQARSRLVPGHNQCTQNPPDLSSSSGEGSVEEIGGLNNYVAGSPHSKKGILLASDVYGYEAPNLRKIADKVAAAGFYVVVPDLIHGDPFVRDNPERPLQEWLKSHDPVKGSEESKPIIAALKAKGISAVGAAGFCWGGKVVVELAKTDYIQAGVLLHPSFVTVDDIKEVKDPIEILGAEHDNMSPPKLLKQFEEILSSKNVDSHVKVFPGVSHGWTVRWNVTDEVAIKHADEAHRDMLEWFKTHIK